VPVDLRIVRAERVERNAAHELQFGVTERRHRRGSSGAVDHRQFADHGARAEDREDAFAAGRRQYAGLQQSIVDPVASVTDVAGKEQRLVGAKRHRPGLCE
jgi:hypothetical protein